MSRYLAAYFAIVGTLAFALPGAASAGQVNIPLNIPRPNISRPQISVPTPRPSVPNVTRSIQNVVPRLTPPGTSTVSGSGAKATSTGSGSGAKATSTGSGSGAKTQEFFQVPVNKTPGSSVSTSGSASANPVSITGGGSFTSSAGASSPSFRCRSKGGVSNCP
jgi:hypothetical protein